MILGLPIRQCAEEVEVSVKTSFYMRHRILDVINLYLKKDIVNGIVEVDEVFINLQKEDPIQRILGGDEFLSKRETNK